MLAAYRVGDSPTNVLTPLMPYSRWTLFIVAWYAIGIRSGRDGRSADTRLAAAVDGAPGLPV